jgi:hypothetical protein
MFYYLKAFYRFTVFHLFRRFATYGTYDDPDLIMGYTGWYTLPVLGCIAFTHRDGDTQFRW